MINSKTVSMKERIARIARIKSYPKPDIKNYELIASTKLELERLKIAQDFLEILGKLDTSVNFTNVYKAPLKRDNNTGHPVINHLWVKSIL